MLFSIKKPFLVPLCNSLKVVHNTFVFLSILLISFWNLIIFCINVDTCTDKMLLLGQNQGPETNTYIVIPFVVLENCFSLHILINNIRNLITFCINVDIHEMLLLQKKKGQGINTVIVIPHCNSLMSVTLLFFLSTA